MVIGLIKYLCTLWVSIIISYPNGNMNPFQNKVTVCQHNSCDYKTIQSAIDAVAKMQNKPVIFIKPGRYQEKLFIDTLISYIKLVGESKEDVIVSGTVGRDVWRCVHQNDFGAAVLNIKGTDIDVRNITFINDFGLISDKDTTIACPNKFAPNVADRQFEDTIKVVSRKCHQFAMRSMPGATRLQFRNCSFLSGGGDTVSQWDVKNGMYFFYNCTIEGHVDCYSPRGRSYAENCTFICHNTFACIWHDGSGDKDDVSVLKNCRFLGSDEFALGRYHKDSKQLLIECNFPNNMANKPIYKAGVKDSLLYGHRVYYFDCTKDGEQFNWYGNNTDLIKENISPRWVFGDKWDIKI